jgi:uncharacterized protein YegP (UPF0339 family)
MKPAKEPYVALPKNRFTIKKDLIGNFNWYLTLNSFEVARSAQGFQKRANCLDSLQRVLKGLAAGNIPIIDTTDAEAGRNKIRARKELR